MKINLKRRDFLPLSGAVPLMMGPLTAWAQTQRAPNWNRTLILIELKGGNDGLNTVIPRRFELLSNAPAIGDPATQGHSAIATTRASS